MKKGVIFSKEHIGNLKKSHVGQKAWNKGIKGMQKWMNTSGLRSHKKGEYKHSNETKKKISQSKKGYHASTTTKEKMKKSAHRGAENGNWKGGVTSENQKVRDSEEYRIWRLKVFFRDNFTCKKCNIKDGTVQAHHIENFTVKELRFEVSNGITLCKKCHNLFHRIYGIKNNTTEQLTLFLN